MKPTAEQDALIKAELSEFGFKDINTDDFYECVGEHPYFELLCYKQALSDLAEILNINKSDIGMNGKYTLVFSPPDRSKESSGAHFEPIANEIHTGYLENGSLSHEWGHLFDKVFSNIINGKEVDEQLDGVGLVDSEYFSDNYLYAMFSMRYHEKCIDIGNQMEEEGKTKKFWYASRPTEMFARAFSTMISMKAPYELDYQYLTHDNRDPKLLKEHGIEPRGEFQHISSLGLPLLNKEEQELFNEKLEYCIRVCKAMDVFHEPDPATVIVPDLHAMEVIGNDDPEGFWRMLKNLHPYDEKEASDNMRPFVDDYYTTFGQKLLEDPESVGEKMFATVNDFESAVHLKLMYLDNYIEISDKLYPDTEEYDDYEYDESQSADNPLDKVYDYLNSKEDAEDKYTYYVDGNDWIYREDKEANEKLDVDDKTVEIHVGNDRWKTIPEMTLWGIDSLSGVTKERAYEIISWYEPSLPSLDENVKDAEDKQSEQNVSVSHSENKNQERE